MTKLLGSATPLLLLFFAHQALADPVALSAQTCDQMIEKLQTEYRAPRARATRLASMFNGFLDGIREEQALMRSGLWERKYGARSWVDFISSKAQEQASLNHVLCAAPDEIKAFDGVVTRRSWAPHSDSEIKHIIAAEFFDIKDDYAIHTKVHGNANQSVKPTVETGPDYYDARARFAGVFGETELPTPSVDCRVQVTGSDAEPRCYLTPYTPETHPRMGADYVQAPQKGHYLKFVARTLRREVESGALTRDSKCLENSAQIKSEWRSELPVSAFDQVLRGCLVDNTVSPPISDCYDLTPQLLIRADLVTPEEVLMANRHPEVAVGDEDTFILSKLQGSGCLLPEDRPGRDTAQSPALRADSLLIYTTRLQIHAGEPEVGQNFEDNFCYARSKREGDRTDRDRYKACVQDLKKYRW